MLSTQADKIKKELIKNRDKNLEYMLNTPIEIQRSDWEDAAMNASLPPDICIEKINDENFSAEWVTKRNIDSQSVILYFHGGGNNSGSSITLRRLVAHIVHHTNMSVLIHNFPLAPEYPFPSALNYSILVYFWLLNKGIKAQPMLLRK